MIPLRKYQKDCIEQFNKVIKRGLTKVLVQQPTGGGKSVILAEIMREWLESEKRILIIAHKIELINQLYDHVHRWHDFKATIMADSKRYRYNPSNRVVIASIQSWSYRYSRANELPEADLVLIDEAHHCASKSYADLFDHYQSSVIVGFTATPRRLDNRGLRVLHHGIKGFQTLIKGVPVRELMDDGFLSEYKLISAGKLVDTSGVKVTAGDYNLKELETVVTDQIPPEEVVGTWYSLAYWKKTVIYPVSVALSKVYCQAFNDNGIPSAHIDAKTPPNQRKQILNKFKNGDIIVLCQHSIIIEGVDVPDIECVQFVRPTKSLVIWYQAIGRALRPAPNKDYAIIIDHTTTHQDLPMPDVPQKWKLDPKEFYVEDFHIEGEDYLCCNNCGFNWHPSKAVELLYFVEQDRIVNPDKNRVEITGYLDPYHCPNCGHSEVRNWTYYETIEQGEGERQVTIEMVTETAVVDPNKPNPDTINIIEPMIQVMQNHGYSKGWVLYRINDNQDLLKMIRYGDLLWLAEQLGYRKGWASYKYESLLYNGRLIDEN